MKNLSSLLGAMILFASCQSSESKIKDFFTIDTTGYPYKLKKIEHWEMNPDKSNAIKILKLIKGFEKLDTAMMGVDLADTVIFKLDGYKYEGDKRGLLESFETEFARMTSFKVTMQDVVSVINKQKTEEYVSLWYEQINITKEGRIDTVYLYNDVKFVDGKILELSEYIQHPVKK